MAEGLGVVALLAREAEPQHVHRRAVVVAFEAGFLAHGRVAAVGPDHEIGADRQFAVRRRGAKPDDSTALLDQVGRLRLHVQIEGRIALAPRGEEIEEVPLRHQRDVFAARRQVREIDHAHALCTDERGQPVDLLMRQLQEFVEQAEFGHQLQGGRVDRVAAEIAKEVGVLLQHRDLDAGTRQQKAEHHAGRTAAGDAALGGDRRVRHLPTFPGSAGRSAGRCQAAGCGVCGATPSFFCRLVDDVVYWNTSRLSG